MHTCQMVVTTGSTVFPKLVSKSIQTDCDAVGHRLSDTQLSDTQLSDSTDYPTVHGLSELRGCEHAGIYDSCAYSTVSVIHVSSN